MKKCSYCGREYPDDTVVCVIDQQPLVTVLMADAASPTATVTKANPGLGFIARNGICPHCGTVNDFTHVVEARSPFRLFIFLLAGIPGLLLRNTGHSRRVRCNQCDTRFYISSWLSKLSVVLLWVLIAPFLILLVIDVLMATYEQFSK